MGRSITCTFSVHTQVGEREYITGAMSLKAARTALLSEIQYAKDNGKPLPTCAYLWAQTARGRKIVGDYDYLEIRPETTTLVGRIVGEPC